ncbi:MAG: tol-pal system protein YbgF [Methylobacter sp.]
MKARFFFMLLCTCSTACAEPLPLPPVVDNSVYPATAAKPARSPAPSTNTLYEMMGRLEQLQVEMQQLTGKVEEQAYQITELKKRQNTMYSDFDERIQGIESKAEGVNQPAAGTPPAQSNSAEIKTPATVPVPAAAPAPAPVPAPANKQAPPVAKPDAAPSIGNEKQEYQQAYDALRNGHTNQAITEFNALLTKYPAGQYANNAQYWLGEAYRVNQNIDSARNAFTKAVENYPGSAKVPDALLKLGYIEYELKNWAKAREYLTRVTGEFPSSSAAHLASKKLLLMDDVKP